jgi:hypothetical protein
MPLEEEFNNMIADMRNDIKKRFAEKFVECLKENIRFYDLIASETLINSIEIDNDYNVIIDCPYASYIEYGIPPTKAPVEKIIAWASIKWGLNERDARNVGWAVRKTIAQRGIEPKPFFRNALNRIKAEIYDYNEIKELAIKKAKELINERIKRRRKIWKRG